MNADHPQQPSTPQPVRVVVTGVDIGFWAAVRLFVKLAFAALPALLVLQLFRSVDHVLGKVVDHLLNAP